MLAYSPFVLISNGDLVSFLASFLDFRESLFTLNLFDNNTKKILNLSIDEKRYKGSHPTKEQCIEIKDEIMKKIKKLYPKYLKSNQLNLF